MKLTKEVTLKIILILFASIAFGIGLFNLSHIWRVVQQGISMLTPILLGLCLAFLLDPLVSTLEKKVFGFIPRRLPKKGPLIARSLGLVTSIIIVAGTIAALMLLVIPEVRDAVGVIGETLPKAITDAVTWGNEMLTKLDVEFRIPTGGAFDWVAFIKNVYSYVIQAFEKGFFNDIANTALVFVSSLFDIVMALVLSIYVLMQRDQIRAYTRRLFRAFSSEKTTEHVFYVAELSGDSFHKFAIGQLTEALIIGLLCFIGMVIFRFPYPTATSAIVGAMALIPVFGAWIGGVVGALLCLSRSPSTALLFIIFLCVLQQLEGNLIYPKVVGKSLGLPSILVFVAVVLGANIGGLLGMLLSVPICAILYVLVNQAMARHLEKKAPPPETENVIPPDTPPNTPVAP